MKRLLSIATCRSPDLESAPRGRLRRSGSHSRATTPLELPPICSSRHCRSATTRGARSSWETLLPATIARTHDHVCPSAAEDVAAEDFSIGSTGPHRRLGGRAKLSPWAIRSWIAKQRTPDGALLGAIARTSRTTRHAATWRPHREPRTPLDPRWPFGRKQRDRVAG